MMNPSKTGSVSGRFSRSTTGSSSTSSTSGNGTFRPYESRRDDIVTVYDINVESLANWIMKNSLSDWVFQTDENSLRRSLTEIKTFEEMFTGRPVSGLIIFFYSILKISFQAVVRYHYTQVRTSSRETVWKTTPVVRARTLFTAGGMKLAEDQTTFNQV